MHVPTAETIDGLFGVADQEQRRIAGGGVVAGTCEYALEDPPLACIGVLELVHQGDRILPAQAAHEVVAMRPLQRVGHAGDHVVVTLHPQLLLERLQARARVPAQPMQQLHPPPLPVDRAGLHRLHVRCHRGAQRRIGHLCLLAAVGLGPHGLGGETGDARVQRRAEITGLAPLCPLAPQLLDPADLVAAAIEHLALQGGAQVGQEASAVTQESLRQRLPGRPQPGQRIGGQRRVGRQQPPLAQQHRQVGGQVGVAALPARGQVIGRHRILGVAAPQVRRQPGMQFTLVGQQLRRVEALPGLQRMLAQGAGAEAMDGEDRRQVDFRAGLAQAPAQLCLALGATQAMVFQQLGGHPCLGAGIVRARAIKHRHGQLQPLRDALAQFLGSCFGVGDGEDLADAEATLDHQARHQGGQGPGLAGAGAGLDQVHALQRQVQVGIVRAHATPSLSSSGSGNASMSMCTGAPVCRMPNTMPASRANSRIASWSANGSRPRRATRKASPSPSAQPPWPLPRHLRAAASSALAGSSRFSNRAQLL